MQSKCEISRAAFGNCLKASLCFYNYTRVHQLQVSSIELSLLAGFCRHRKVFSLSTISQENAPKYKSLIHFVTSLRDTARFS